MAKRPTLPSQNPAVARLKAAAKLRPMSQKKGPRDLIDDLKKKRVAVEQRIVRGESGDGINKQDLFAVRKGLKGEIRRLESANRAPERPRRNAQVISTTVRERPSPTRKK